MANESVTKIVVKPEEQLQTTDMGQPPKRAPEFYEVRVHFEPGAAQATVRSKCGKLDLRYPAGLLEKRVPRGTRIAYFRAEVDGLTETLEIGEQLHGRIW